MERLMDKFKCKAFPYTNPITWIATPIVFLFYVSYYCFNSEKARKQIEDRNRRQREIEDQRERERELENLHNNRVIVTSRFEDEASHSGTFNFWLILL